MFNFCSFFIRPRKKWSKLNRQWQPNHSFYWFNEKRNEHFFALPNVSKKPKKFWSRVQFCWMLDRNRYIVLYTPFGWYPIPTDHNEIYRRIQFFYLYEMRSRKPQKLCKAYVTTCMYRKSNIRQKILGSFVISDF